MYAQKIHNLITRIIEKNLQRRLKQNNNVHVVSSFRLQETYVMRVTFPYKHTHTKFQRAKTRETRPRPTMGRKAGKTGHIRIYESDTINTHYN